MRNAVHEQLEGVEADPAGRLGGGERVSVCGCMTYLRRRLQWLGEGTDLDPGAEADLGQASVAQD